MGGASKTCIIAEVGINFNGDFHNCVNMISMAANAGCDAVKFQLFSAENLYPKSAGKLDWKDGEKAYSYDIFEAAQSMELPREWVLPLKETCEKQGVEFLCSVFHESDLEFIRACGTDRIKLSSSSLTNLPFIKNCAASGLGIILSTGGGRLIDVEKVVDTITAHHNNLILLHCSIQYPTPLEECNLSVIKTYRTLFPEVKAGYSDHTLSPVDAPVAAVALGASVIEKHITLDKKMEGPDHFFALEEQELNEMVQGIRSYEKTGALPDHINMELLKGSPRKQVSPAEEYLKSFVQNQIFVKTKIKSGQTIKPKDLIVLRRGKKEAGLTPDFMALFEKHRVTSKTDIPAEAPLSWDMILN